MESSMFKELKESVREAGRISRGEQPASRVFKSIRCGECGLHHAGNVKQKPRFWRNPMQWLRNRLWNWLTRDMPNLAFESEIEGLAARSKGMNQMIGRLCGRVQSFEDLEAEYDAQGETAFDDEMLTAIFARLQRQTDIVNKTQDLSVDALEKITRHLEVIGNTMCEHNVAFKDHLDIEQSLHKDIENVKSSVDRVDRRVDRLSQAAAKKKLGKAKKPLASKKKKANL